MKKLILLLFILLPQLVLAQAERIVDMDTKTTLVAGDITNILDSEASNVDKNTTMGNIATYVASTISDGGIGEFNGTESLTVTGTDAIGIGIGTASGDNSIMIGNTASASDLDAIAIGDATASGGQGIAIGDGANAGSSRAIGIGFNANAAGSDTVSIGYGITNSSTGGVAIGRQCTSGASGVCIGYTADATQTGSIAIGDVAQSTGTGGIAIGDGSAASGSYATAIGKDTKGTATNSVAIGHYSESRRLGEMSIAIEKASDPNAQMGIDGYVGATTDDTPKEIFPTGSNNNRFSMWNDGQLVKFKGIASAWDNTNAKGAGWSFTGAIKRTSTTVSLVGAGVTSTLDEYDTGMDSCAIAITANDAEDSLTVTVTGLAATSIAWAVRIDYIDTINR